MMGVRADDSPAGALAPREERALIAKPKAGPLKGRLMKSRREGLALERSAGRLASKFREAPLEPFRASRFARRPARGVI